MAMTLDELVEWAKNCSTADMDERAGALDVRAAACAVLDLLAEALPCGYETPYCAHTGEGPVIHAQAFCGGPGEARAFAAAILRAADGTPLKLSGSDGHG